MSAAVETIIEGENDVAGVPKKTKLYNDRTLSIKTDNLTPEEICTAIQGVMMYIRVNFGFPAYFHLAYVMIKTPEGKIIPQGYCYLTVNRPEVYHLLLGRKPDGSENIDYIQDPEWVAPPEEEEIEEEEDELPPLPDFRAPAKTYTSWNDFPSFSQNWADIMDAEIKKEQRKIERTPPMIKVFLGKLIPEPKVLTKDGWHTIEIVASRVKVDLSADSFLKIDTNKIQGFFPEVLSVKEIESYFKAFSTPLIGHPDPYPEVIESKIRDQSRGQSRGPPSRLVTVKFRPQYHDALFVIQTNLRCVMRDKHGNRHVVYIKHPPAHDGK